MTELENILIGGSGNDIITAKGGHNIMIDGDDIIISTDGNNIISAGKGNNVIVINYNNNETKIFLDEGETKTYTQGIGNIYKNESVDNNLVISSLDSRKEIIIYDYEKYKNNVEISTSLNNKNINLLISAASAFQHNNYETVVANLDNDKRDFVNKIYQYKEISNL
ncbi:hypothetical protein [Arsenophonus endosymbiont of Aleurodicus floccissimus]|uniref:hypothetical protein n=1 Tax=Arsenophonus endosymbiont of Aleurodicus floccissimus TaxID=2152761 RepID=UPI0011C46F2C|nr:hypothetical protein [Arsenophonus endosymbiont of Aleurodicus floccissimus]